MTNVSIFYMLLGILSIFLLLYILLELHYFVRTFLSIVLARICRKKVHVLDETVVKGVCLTTDIDSLLTHMNNARFVRELDFAKIDFYERTGLYQNIKSHGGGVALGATTIRYRRYIKLFTRYYITTKVIFWDEKHIYMEHKFISNSDKFVNAIVLCKIRLLNCNADLVLSELLNKTTIENVESTRKEKPELPPELEKWIESNEISSALLRKTTSE